MRAIPINAGYSIQCETNVLCESGQIKSCTRHILQSRKTTESAFDLGSCTAMSSLAEKGPHETCCICCILSVKKSNRQTNMHVTESVATGNRSRNKEKKRKERFLCCYRNSSVLGYILSHHIRRDKSAVSLLGSKEEP